MNAIVELVISEHGQSMAAAHASGGFRMLGVSFGALVAFEVACVMTQRNLPPSHLVVASQAAPTSAAIEVNFDVDDAALAHMLGGRGWLAQGIAQSREAR